MGLIGFTAGINENPLPVGVELFHTDGRIDRHDKASSHFSKIFRKRQNIAHFSHFRL
jgi:hypothetical protein